MDFISDAKAEPGGFHQAGINATNELRAYCSSQKLTKENTILFITGHSYGASSASLVGIMSTDLAERDSIFCYSYATPNYIRNGLTGEGTTGEANGEPNKQPKAVVIKDGAYASMD